MALVLAGFGFLPYAADRLVIRRLPAFAATLVFPLVNTAIEFGLSRVSPFGAWGLIAYSQVEFVPLAQLAALTGAAGISFLVCWVASVTALVWERWDEPRRWRASAVTAGIALAVAIGWGAARLASAAGAETVRVAIVLPSVQNNRNYDASLAPGIEADLLAQSRKAAAMGARIVVRPEDSFFIPLAAEPEVGARAAALERELHVYLGVAYGLRTEPGTLRYHNRFVLFGPDGAPAWRYDKSYPVPGYEQANMIPGDRRAARTNSPIGDLVGAICFDGDHDAMLRQLRGARLALLPSDDWPAITTLHARMVRLRAIEAGVPVVRPTINGMVLAADRFGRAVLSAESLHAGPVLVADVPLAAR